MNPRRAWALLSFALVAYSQLASAHSQSPTFSVDTNLQSVAVQVTDGQGNPVDGLVASDFILLEDGRPQRIAFFASKHEPVTLAVLLDVSRAMDFGGRMDRALALLAPLLRCTHPKDEILLIPFADQIGAVQQVTNDQRLKLPAFGPLGHRGSALYDALAGVLCRMRTAGTIRQTVVVITAGMDQDSRLRLEQVIGLVGSSSSQVFMVGLFDAPAYRIFSLGQKTVSLTGLREVDNPVLAFRRLAKETGAESFFPSSDADLGKALNRISAILASEYTLAYYPARIDSVRNIEVKVKRGGVKTLTRRTVGSGTTLDPVRFTQGACAISPREYPHPWESRVKSTPSSGIVYHEDFSDPRSGWPNSHDPNTDAHYIRGGYQLSRSVRVRCEPFAAVAGEAANAGDAVIAAYGPWWTNFRASAKLEGQPDPWWKFRRDASTRNGPLGPWWRTDSDSAIPDRGSCGVGLVFNLMEQGYYALLLVPDATGNGTAAELVRGDWTGTGAVLMPPVRVTAANLQQQASHTLSVECNRGEFTVVVDARTVGKLHDTSFGFGLVGFGVFGGGRLVVRDLRVEALP